MCSMSQKQKESALIYSQKTLEIEGLIQTDEIIKFSRQYLNGEINSNDAILNIRNQILAKKERMIKA